MKVKCKGERTSFSLSPPPPPFPQRNQMRRCGRNSRTFPLFFPFPPPFPIPAPGSGNSPAEKNMRDPVKKKYRFPFSLFSLFLHARSRWRDAGHRLKGTKGTSHSSLFSFSLFRRPKKQTRTCIFFSFLPLCAPVEVELGDDVVQGLHHALPFSPLLLSPCPDRLLCFPVL